MSFLYRNYHQNVTLTGIAKLGVVIFIVGLASGFFRTVWALYIDSFVHSASFVGFIVAGLTVASFIFRFLFVPLIQRTGKSKLFSFALFWSAVLIIVFSFRLNIYLFLIVAALVTIFTVLRTTSFGLMIRDKSGKKQLSRNEGFIYVLFNLSWVIGPLIGGLVLVSYGMSNVFVLTSAFLFLAWLFFKFSRVRDNVTDKKVDSSLIKNFRDFFKSRNRIMAYILGGGVNFWWSLIYTFIPLYIVMNGLATIWVAYFMFAVPIPLIFLEYKFSDIAGRQGFKKIFKIGFLMVAILAVACFFVSSVFVVLGILVLASFGMAMLEPTTEAYYFDVSSKKDTQRFYSPYTTTVDLNVFIAQILSAVLLLFLPFRFIFLLYGGVMLLMFLICFKIKNVVEGKKR